MEHRRFLEIMSIKETATQKELQAAYKRLVKIWHPDQFVYQPKHQAIAQEKLKEINIAYQEASQFIKGREEKGKCIPSDDLGVRHQDPHTETKKKTPPTPWRSYYDRIKKNLVTAKKQFSEMKMPPTGSADRARPKKEIMRPQKGYEPSDFNEVFCETLQARGSGVANYSRKRQFPWQRVSTCRRMASPKRTSCSTRPRGRCGAQRIEKISPVAKINRIGKIR